MKNTRAFTLIELLVVIAIIAILAAILFPVFVKARQNAKIMKCLQHSRQVGNGLFLYTADYGDRFPAGSASPAVQAKMSSHTWRYTWGGNTKWRREIWDAGMCTLRFWHLKPYVKNEDVFICPDPQSEYARRYAYGFRMSWCFHGGDGGPDGDHGFGGRTTGEVQGLDAKGGTGGKGQTFPPRYMPASRKVLLFCYSLGGWYGATKSVGDGAWPWIFPAYPHGDGTTYVFADGHAAWRRQGAGFAPLGYTEAEVDNTQ